MRREEIITNLPKFTGGEPPVPPALATAEEQLQKFPDEARRAGAPPGWFRELNDDY